MNKIKSLILGSLIALGTGQAFAEYGVDDCNACREYVCGCNPLYCGAFSLQLHAGIAPITWRHRGEVALASAVSGSGLPLVVLSDSFPKFSKLYKLPWIVGGAIGYDFSDNVEVYLEANYLQASRKSSNAIAFVIPNTVPTQSFVITAANKYKLFDMYIGARYYFDRYCNFVAWFLGAKVGFTHHSKASGSLALNGFQDTCPANPISVCGVPGCINCTATNANAGCLIGCDGGLFTANTVVSGGFNFGLDFCVCGNWSVVLMGEIVASCGPDINTITTFAAPLVPPTLATNLIVGCIQTELRFPITAGVRYTF